MSSRFLPKNKGNRFSSLSSVRMSAIPVVATTPDYERAVQQFSKYGERLESGAEKLLLHVASAMVEELADMAPQITGLDYRKDLKLGLVQNVSDTMASVAIYFDERRSTLGSLDAERLTALWYGVREDSPPFVSVLQRWSPWPASLVPMEVNRFEADVIARTLTDVEIKELSEKFSENAALIESQLLVSGVRVKIKPGDAAAGTEVAIDIGHAILRHELGVMESPKPHWVPALRRVQSKANELMRMFVSYVETGNDAAFDLPSRSGVSTVSASDLKRGSWFSDKIEQKL